ncbi:MAG: subclass B3 metallo-beta-lactamase [Actinomycetota bacterium]
MKKFVLLLFTLTFCFPLAAFAQKSESDRAMNRPVEPFKIIGNIYYVGASDVTSYLITTPQGHILIDGGFAETAPQIEANVEKLGFKLADIKILLINHAHYDHCGGLAELKKLSGARLYASPPDTPVLEDGGISDFRFGGDKPLFTPVKVDKILQDREKISLGDAVLTTYFTFGHTKGATSWTMEVSENGQKYKVAFISSLTTLDYALANNPKYPAIAADFTKTLATLKKLKPDVFLASHGQFFDLTEKSAKLRGGAKPNPFIDPQGYQKLIERMSQAFEDRLKAEKERKVGL